MPSPIRQPAEESNFYFSRMRETTLAIFPLLRGWLEALAPDRSDFAGLSDALFVYIDRFRCVQEGVPKTWARPYLARIFFEAACDRAWTNELPVFAIPELFNVAAHQSNLGFDQKLPPDDSRRGPGEDGQFIASFLGLGEVCRRAQDTFQGSGRDLALEVLLDASRDVYQGQYLDLNTLQLAHSADIEAAEFRRLYLRRCLLMGGGTYEICALGAIAAGADPAYVYACRRFLRALGAAAQIINDVRDLDAARSESARVPPDLRAGKLTLPIHVLLSEPGGAEALLGGCSEPGSLQWLRRAAESEVPARAAIALIREAIWPQIKYYRRKLLSLKTSRHNLNFVSHFVFGSLYDQIHATRRRSARR